MILSSSILFIFLTVTLVITSDRDAFETRNDTNLAAGQPYERNSISFFLFSIFFFPYSYYGWTEDLGGKRFQNIILFSFAGFVFCLLGSGRLLAHCSASSRCFRIIVLSVEFPKTPPPQLHKLIANNKKNWISSACFYLLSGNYVRVLIFALVAAGHTGSLHGDCGSSTTDQISNMQLSNPLDSNCTSHAGPTIMSCFQQTGKKHMSTIFFIV